MLTRTPKSIDQLINPSISQTANQRAVQPADWLKSRSVDSDRNWSTSERPTVKQFNTDDNDNSSERFTETWKHEPGFISTSYVSYVSFCSYNWTKVQNGNSEKLFDSDDTDAKIWAEICHCKLKIIIIIMIIITEVQTSKDT